MDITAFIAQRREALLIGDYNTYRAQLSRQLQAARKRLGLATPKREKFSKKAVTAGEIGGNHEFAHLLLLTSERAWAHAMHMKTAHAEESKGITGSTRSHIISRLAKAAKVAHELVGLLRVPESKGGERDVLEARAYQASLAGGEEFEKQAEGQRSGDGQASAKRWEACLRLYAVARVIYAALYEKERKEVYREILANTVDPTIRYAAYQAHLSRTIAIPTVAKRYFPRDDTELVGQVEKLDPYALKDKPTPKTDGEEKPTASPQEIPNSVTWRGRKANIVDASIGQALASVGTAESRLRSYLSANPTASARDKAAAYDDILIASQDAADATKRAADELEKERVDEGDSRMQDLRVTSLAVNYDLVSWRVGRNRVLIGQDDGLTFSAQQQKKQKRLRKDGTAYVEKEEPRSRKLARLRERVVLYDATIQSIQSVKDLRGAMRDGTFVSELDGKVAYFRALKCLNISYSHTLLGNHLNALALLKRAVDLLAASTPSPVPASAQNPSDKDAPPTTTLEISVQAAEGLQKQTANLLARTHALVEMHKLEANARTAAEKQQTSAAPLVQNLNAYPTPGVRVDLGNLVGYPPRIQPVPVKPLFLDVAWNYIEYPGRKAEAPVEEAGAPPVADTPMVNGGEEESGEKPAEKKKGGWFGFGR
ncbi:hypothetical protein LTR36_004183 [Oleoguttula mirabilis]|uniref:Signal recognition particle subunit SRP68 n=1 Tax=Oleoguttula mirabilis TaxID=1507867 RepID=A0AAV9JHA8_9PEZI|nr:hypothetical protein LTR36_004183 [Oleoguttula mirabilis]